MRRLLAQPLTALALPLVVVVVLGVAIAYELVGFVDAVVNGLIVTPVTVGRLDPQGEEFGLASFASRQNLSLVVWGVPFYFRSVLSSGLSLIAVLAIAGPLLRILKRAIATCTECGSVVPVTATVCHACAADLESARTGTLVSDSD